MKSITFSTFCLLTIIMLEFPCNNIYRSQCIQFLSFLKYCNIYLCNRNSMKKMIKFVILVCSLLQVVELTEEQDCNKSVILYPPGVCPTGRYQYHNTCACGDFFKYDQYVTCDLLQVNLNVRLYKGYCMTFDKTTNLTYSGKCSYSTRFNKDPYLIIPKNVFYLNEWMCGDLNRTGLLCSQCQPGLGPAVFSYYRECKECLTYPYGWILFFVRSVITSTLFCIVLIILQVNIATPALNGFILAAQIIAIVFNNNSFIIFGLSWSYTFPKFVVDIYGLFNLDFFTYLIPSFCISKDMTMLTVIALDYITALYPILFTVVVYISITLHDKGVKIVVLFWRPFHKCFARCRRKWELEGSVVNAFATFLLLSFCKTCSISFNLLQNVKVWDICGSNNNRLYYEASVEPYSTEHIPFLVMSIVMTIGAGLPVVFLLFYQNRFFQKFLSACGINCTLIHELAKITQGCFKNGTTHGTRDYRWLAGGLLVVRFILMFMINQKYGDLLYIIFFNILSFTFLALRPYSNEFHNIVDSSFWTMFTLSNSWYLYYQAFNDVWRDLPHLIKVLPLLYIAGYTFYMMFRRCQRGCKSIRKRKNRDNIITDMNEDIPDRLLRPHMYTPIMQHKPLFSNTE